MNEVSCALLLSTEATRRASKLSASAAEDLVSKEWQLLNTILKSNVQSIISVKYSWISNPNFTDDLLLSLSLYPTVPTVAASLHDRNILVRCITFRQGITTHVRTLQFRSSPSTAVLTIPLGSVLALQNDLRVLLLLPVEPHSPITLAALTIPLADIPRRSEADDSLQLLRVRRHIGGSDSCNDSGSCVFKSDNRCVLVSEAQKARRDAIDMQKLRMISLVRTECSNNITRSDNIYSLPLRLQETNKLLSRIYRSWSDSSSDSRQNVVEDLWLCYKTLREYGA